MGRIDNLNVNLEAGRSSHDAGQLRGLVPLELRAGSKPKALLAGRTIDDVFRNVDWFVALSIVFRKEPDVSRRTDTGVDSALS
jgi:hypothetical protein